MEACDDDSAVLLDVAVDERGFDFFDASASVRSTGDDASLASRGGDGVDAHFVEGDREEGDGLLLTGGEEDVEFSLGGVVGEFLG